MLGRRKTNEPEAAAKPDAEQGPGKNRPTPKRREVEAARRQPLVPAARTNSGKGGKATKEDKQAARERRVEARQRMMAGEERYLPARDQGPVRKFARDFVDARWNLGEILLPVMFVFICPVVRGQRASSRTRACSAAWSPRPTCWCCSPPSTPSGCSAGSRSRLRAKFGDKVDLHGVGLVLRDALVPDPSHPGAARRRQARRVPGLGPPWPTPSWPVASPGWPVRATCATSSGRSWSPASSPRTCPPHRPGCWTSAPARARRRSGSPGSAHDVVAVEPDARDAGGLRAGRRRRCATG